MTSSHYYPHATALAMAAQVDFANITLQDLEGVGIGLVSEAVRMRGTNIVAKIPAISPTFPRELHDVEKAVYERLGQHANILRYLGQAPPECSILKGALLFEYHSRGTLRGCIHNLHTLFPDFLE